MDRHLNLIKNETLPTEKRIFPRFPFSFLTFKADANGTQSEHVFEIVDISFTGMQMLLKFGSHSYKTGSELSGTIHWKGANIKVKGQVKWIHEQRLGIKFELNDTFSMSLKKFLSVENVVSCMRPIHGGHMGLELPTNLRYWLRADGPFEVFVWSHNDLELSKFQVITMENFIEWEDGKGLKSGRVLSKRDLDTPLFQEDECVFQIDETFDKEKLGFATKVVEHVPSHYLTNEVKEFILMKLGAK